MNRLRRYGILASKNKSTFKLANNNKRIKKDPVSFIYSYVSQQVIHSVSRTSQIINIQTERERGNTQEEQATPNKNRK